MLINTFYYQQPSLSMPGVIIRLLYYIFAKKLTS